MAVSVRNTLEKLGHTVSYDAETGGVLVEQSGKMVNIGNGGFTLKDDGRYYADNTDAVYSALEKNGLSAGKGWSAARNTLSPTEFVGYNEKTRQLSVNGKDYNVDGDSLVHIGNTIYGKNEYLNSLRQPVYDNSLKDLEDRVLGSLQNNKYQGYDSANDRSYQNAHSDYMKKAKADMGSRGLISDSLISHYAAQGASELLPVFQQADFEKHKEENQRLNNLLGAINSAEAGRRDDYKTNVDAENKTMLFAAAQEQRNSDNKYREDALAAETSLTAYKEAAAKAELLGYVPEELAEILGIAAGTPTYEAREAIDKRMHDAAMEQKKHEYNMEELNYKSEQEEQIKRLASELKISEVEAAAYYRYLYQ